MSRETIDNIVNRLRNLQRIIDTSSAAYRSEYFLMYDNNLRLLQKYDAKQEYNDFLGWKKVKQNALR